MSDDTAPRRAAQLPAMAAALAAAIDRGEPVWDTAALRRDYRVEGYLAPYVVVTRKADGQRGTLRFTHNPRVYFGFEATF